MASRLPLSLLGFLCSSLPFSQAGSDWISLSLKGPNGITDTESPYYYVNDVSVGTPPAAESLLLNIGSPVLAFSSDACIFCPGSDLFDPTISTTYNSTDQQWPGADTDFNGVLAQDTVSLGDVLTASEVPFRLIKTMSQNFTSRFLDGHFGLYVNATTDATRREHILTHLHSSGQLLNPVVGIRLGNTPETSHISIGALDTEQFDGTINWVQAESPDPSWDSPTVLKLDGFRGFDGTFLPYPNPLLTYLDSRNRNILLPNAWTYISQERYRGPVDSISIDADFGSYGYICNETSAYVHMSVDINGVNYQIDSQDNLLRNQSPAAVFGHCNVGVNNLTTTASIPSLLGLPFLRSVYFAYRFPTEDCPNAYFGFAFPKGANRTSEMLSQQPRETPSASAQCLSFSKPTSTPTVSTPSPQASADKWLSQNSYDVWPNSDGQQVRLKGVDELLAGLVRGVEIVGDDDAGV